MLLAAGWWNAVSRQEPAELARAVLNALAPHGDRGALSSIGARYIACHPKEADLQRLCRVLVGDLRPSDPELRRSVTSRIRADFASKDVAQVDGWILSKTEARICALASLVEAQA